MLKAVDAEVVAAIYGVVVAAAARVVVVVAVVIGADLVASS